MSDEISDQSTQRRSPQGSGLDRDRILRTALRLADERGVAGLSMRKLARALGVEAMSLYHHVPNKDSILDGLVDLIFEEILLPEGPDWKEAMRRRAHSARDVLVRHPWVLPLLVSRRNPGVATLRHNDAVLGCLRGAGFSVSMAGHGIALVDAYIFGFALQQSTLPLKDQEQIREVTAGIIVPEVVESFPHLAELAVEQVMKPGYDYGDEFPWGLELVLEGLAARLPARD